MSRLPLTSTDTRLVILPDGGPLSGNSVGVPADTAADTVLFSVEAGAEPVRAAVRLVPLPEVPAGFVAVGRGLAAALDLGEGLSARDWRLDAVTVVDLRSIQLETPGEAVLEESARALAEAGLEGQLIWLPGDGRELWLTVDGVPHRVRAWDTGGGRQLIGRIGPRTVVDMYSPGERNGVDMVILADCSGSMSCDDIEYAGAEAVVPGRDAVRRRPAGGRSSAIPRMEALRHVLSDLLRIRLTLGGRTSRIAVLEFTDRTVPRFPFAGGMAELDAGSPSDLVEEYRKAVALLQAQTAPTDIGLGIHEAASVLFRYGKPGNDKLIVLVSDGAQWVPRGEQGTGEVVMATREPVTLMEHLHRETGVRLHAIGISTLELYETWRRRTGMLGEPAFVPNHQLLSRLVAVGGGDPATIGGYDVLAEYFSGLGAGLTRRVEVRRPAEDRGRRGLPEEAREMLRAVTPAAGGGSDQASDRRRRTAAENVSELAGRCMQRAHQVLGHSLLNASTIKDQVQGRFSDAAVENPQQLWRAFIAVRNACRPMAAAHSIVPRYVAAYDTVLDSFELRRGQAEGSAAVTLGLAEELVAALEDLLRGLEQAQPMPAPDRGGPGHPGQDHEAGDEAAELHDPLAPAGATVAGGTSAGTDRAPTFRFRG